MGRAKEFIHLEGTLHSKVQNGVETVRNSENYKWLRMAGTKVPQHWQEVGLER